MNGIQAVLVKCAAGLTACGGIALFTLAISPGNAATLERLAGLTLQQRVTVNDIDATALAERFPAAPDGVDPIVTGPVSASFKQERVELDCDGAIWPRIPLGCYPD